MNFPHFTISLLMASTGPLLTFTGWLLKYSQMCLILSGAGPIAWAHVTNSPSMTTDTK